MFSKIIYVLALLCVVNAAVMTVNVFDDDPETEVSFRKAECTFLECNRHCRDRYGYSGTYANCINGRCKCNSFRDRNAKISRAAESLSIPEEPANLEDCNYRACDQLCHRLGIPGGACVNGRCKCDNFRSSEGEIFRAAESLSISEEPATPEDCNYRACDQLCHRLGFPGGACVNGRCKCDNFRSSEGEISRAAASLSNPEDPATLEDCNIRACDQMCRRYGFTGGDCINGRCQCHNFRSTEGEITRGVEPLSIPKEPVALEDCNFGACDQLCRRYGYNVGVCVNGRCRCHNYRSAEGGISRAAESLSIPKEPVALEDCNSEACNQMCRRYGYNGGDCVNGHCRCHNFHSTEGEIPRAAESLSNPEEPANLEDCNFQACDQLCHRLGFTGGACVNGHCKCDNFLYSEEPTTVSDTTKVEDEESHLILKTDKDKVILPTIHACEAGNCNELCRVLNYAGGTCTNGVCSCY